MPRKFGRVKMNDTTIPFLKIWLKGGDVEKAVQTTLEQRRHELDKKFSLFAKELIDKQALVETQVRSICAQVSALKVTDQADKQVNAENDQIVKLRNVQTQLEGALKTKQEQLKTSKEDSDKLNTELLNLKQQVEQVPSQYESKVLEIGDSMSQNIGNL
jgi:hypothetical protein